MKEQLIDLALFESNYSLKIEEDSVLILKNFNNIKSINFEIEENVNSTISFLMNELDLNLFVDIKVKKNSQLNVFMADFTTGKVVINSNVDLVDKEANCQWQLASLTKDKDNKNIDTTINHLKENTSSFINNYGVCRNDSKLVFSGVCHIYNGCIHSVANQNAKIMVFDEKSVGIAKPILKIDENDVQASHAAAVGKISDDQLFYLTSRGIDLEQAKRLVTFGYLKPILKGFDEKSKEYLSDLIEKSF